MHQVRLVLFAFDWPEPCRIQGDEWNSEYAIGAEVGSLWVALLPLAPYCDGAIL